MKAIPFLSGVLLLLALGACQNDTRQNTEREKNQPNTQRESPVKLIEYLVGDWQTNDATGNRNGDQQSLGEELTFTSEARYIIRKGGQKVDSGAYRMNEQLMNLYLESETSKTPREFELDIKGDTPMLSPAVMPLYRPIGNF